MSEHELWNELGNLYFLSGAYAQAVFAYQRSIQMDEGFGRPYSNLALTYVQQGKFEEAVDLYRRSIELLTENREKAISWNRLGNVYRYLKDYQEALVAYRRADELDPENDEGRESPGWVREPSGPTPSEERGQPLYTAVRERTATRHIEVAAEPTQDEDVIVKVEAPAQEDVIVAEVSQEVVTPAMEQTAETWSAEDTTLFQQDVSDALEPGSLTTWGDTELDVEGPEQETEVYIPDIEGDDLSKWLPNPNEAPEDALEFFLDFTDFPEEDQLISEEDALANLAQVLEMSKVPAEPPKVQAVETEAQAEEPEADVVVTSEVEAAAEELEEPAPILALLPVKSSSVTTGAEPEPSMQDREVDVIVQERPSTEFVVATEPEPALVDEVKEQMAVEAKAVEAAPAAELPTAVAEPVRDEDEMREIEAGLAKFKRVVQVNPKNARAWDTLGNLYKTAGLYKEALLAYQQAITNDPAKALYHHHLGLVYACEGRIEEAIDAFQKVIEIDPEHSLAHAALGGYYRKMGLEELAQKHVGAAMKNIFDSENEYNKACLAAICGDTDQALELLRIALKNRQTYVDWILRDPDLDFIRQDPRFKQLIADYAR